MRTARVAVGTTRETLSAGRGVHGVVKIRNTGPNSVVVGDSTVTASNGFAVLADSVADFPLAQNESLYGICDTLESANVQIFES